jgi:dUTPase
MTHLDTKLTNISGTHSGTSSKTVSQPSHNPQSQSLLTPTPPPTPQQEILREMNLTQNHIPFEKKEEAQKKKGDVTTCLPASPIREMPEKGMKGLLTTIKVDSEDYKPQYVSTNKTSIFFFAKTDRLSLPHRSTATIDTGIRINVPKRYRLSVDIVPDLSAKGLLLHNYYVQEDGRLKVIVTNIGKEIVVISDKDRLGVISLESLYAINLKFGTC